MGNIVTATELAHFLNLKDNSGALLNPTSTSDPSDTYLNQIISGVEGDFDARTYHSWGHISTVTNESHDIPYEGYEFGRGMPVHLSHYKCQPLDSASGDELEIWNGISWQSIINDTGRHREIPELGKIFLLGLIWTRIREDRMRATYRYGTMEVPPDIKFAVLKKCASVVLEASFSMNQIPTGIDRGISNNQVLERWNEEYEACIVRWAGLTRIEY